MRKRKAAIITLNHGINYGNKLQNYALQSVYEKLGYEAETIQFYPKGSKVIYNKKRKLSVLFKRLVAKLNDKIYSKNIEKRKHVFSDFNDSQLNMTEKCYTPMDYSTIPTNEYDLFSVGSDQVWNSYFFDFIPMYLLDFVDDSSKKIAYAASFGVNDVSDKYVDLFKSCLMDFKFISVRENTGRDIINNLIGKDAPVVLDPTLLLDKKEWSEFAETATAQVPSKYIVIYFLGKIDKQKIKRIKNYAKSINSKIVVLNNIKNSYYGCGPKEFVRLISNAECVFTDSFHASCFSVMFHVPFWVFERTLTVKNMGSRLTTLLNMLGLEERRFSMECQLNDQINFKRTDELLAEKRNESLKLLSEAIGVVYNDDKDKKRT